MILLEWFWCKEYIIIFFERNINIEEEAIKTESLSRETPLDTTVLFSNHSNITSDLKMFALLSDQRVHGYNVQHELSIILQFSYRDV